MIIRVDLMLTPHTQRYIMCASLGLKVNYSLVY